MITTFGMLTPTVVIVLLIIVLIIFGPGKLPEIGKGLGKSISEFKKATSDEPKDVASGENNNAKSEEPKKEA